MAIPKFDAIRIQALKLLGNGQTLKPKDFFQPLAEQFRLDENDKNAMYPSGNGYIFYDRISWALSYLYLAQLVDKPQRGLYRINPQGLKMLSEHTPEEINDYVEQTVQARTPRKSRRAGTTTEALALSDTPSGELTPQEALEQSFDNIRKSVYAEILETIIGKSPRAFERLVVQLLQAMGYGGEVKGSGQVTRASKDGGIDGIIKEDILGFGRIYIQAKRYGLNYAVQRDEVQKFVGALAVAQSHKGVFITTSYFTSGAIDYVKGLNGAATIVLIDGKQLAEYIYDFGLGMQSVKTIHIKKPDNDFWDAMEDDDKKTTAKFRFHCCRVPPLCATLLPLPTKYLSAMPLPTALIDTHSHIYAEEFDADRDEAIRRAREAGVERLLLPAIDSESHERLFDVVRRYPDRCTPMMGLHPTSINDNPRWREELALVERYLCSPPEGVGRFCAVGEIGLDYYWDDRFKAEQLEAFTTQCRLAATYDLPVAVHTRAAWDDMCRTVETETKAAREKGLRLRGVFHAFAEDADTYRQLKECGDFLFGIGGVVTFKKSRLADTVREMGLSDLVLETDCPYLTPVPYRGQRNESGYIPYICNKIAALKDTTPEEVAAATTRNARRVFGFDAARQTTNDHSSPTESI